MGFTRGGVQKVHPAVVEVETLIAQGRAQDALARAEEVTGKEPQGR